MGQPVDGRYQAAEDAVHHQHDFNEETEKRAWRNNNWLTQLTFELDRIYRALAQCTMFMAIGTSGVVEPAASFVARRRPCADNLCGAGGTCERILNLPNLPNAIRGRRARYCLTCSVPRDGGSP
jgi:NAD-dependent SIR2 family protein deacetylase